MLDAIMAPTDAALGKPVVTDPAVLAVIREALNLESGLNDEASTGGHDGPNGAVPKGQRLEKRASAAVVQ